MGTDARAGGARWGRRELAHVALLFLLTALHWAPRLRGPIDLRYDAGVYYVLGTSLAEGRGYRLLNEPGEIEAIQYPPLLPAWVALHQLVLGTDDALVVGQALRLSSAALSFAFALAVYALARRALPGGSALLASVVAVLYFHVLYLEDLCFAEQPFALVVVLFLLVFGQRGRLARVAEYGLALAAFFLRTAGVALFVAWIVEALTRRRWNAAGGRALVSLLAMAAWQAHVQRVTHGPEYSAPAYAYQRAPYQFYNVSYAENVALRDPFVPESGRIRPVELGARVLGNLGALASDLGESVSAPRGFWEWPLKWLDKRGVHLWLWPVAVPLVLLSLLVLAGHVALWRADWRLLVLFSAFSLGLVALTPWPGQFSRYLAPLTPLLTIALARGLDVLRTPACGRTGRWAYPALWTLVLCVQAFTLRQTFAVYHHSLIYHGRGGEHVPGSLFLYDEGPGWNAYYDGLWWLQEHSAPEDVVATSAPHLVYLHTGRKAVMPPLEVDVERAQELLDSVPARWLVVDELRFVDISRRYARPVIRAHPELWEEAWRAADGWLAIYRRR